MIVDSLPTTINLKKRNIIGGDPVYLSYVCGEFEDTDHIPVNYGLTIKLS